MKQNEIKLHYFLLNHLEVFKPWQPYPNVYKKLTRQNLVRFFEVRNGVFVEIKSAFQQFVKEKNYAKILVLSTILNFNRAVYYLIMELKHC